MRRASRRSTSPVRGVSTRRSAETCDPARDAIPHASLPRRRNPYSLPRFTPPLGHKHAWEARTAGCWAGLSRRAGHPGPAASQTAGVVPAEPVAALVCRAERAILARRLASCRLGRLQRNRPTPVRAAPAYWGRAGCGATGLLGPHRATAADCRAVRKASASFRQATERPRGPRDRPPRPARR